MTKPPQRYDAGTATPQAAADLPRSALEASERRSVAASSGPEATAHFGLEGPHHEGGVSAECVGGRVRVRTYGDRSIGGGDGDFSPEEFAQRWGATAQGARVVAWLHQAGWLGARSG